MLIQDSIELCLARLKDHLQKERYSPARVRHYVAVNRWFLTYLKKQHIEIGQANPLDVCSYLKAASRSYRQRYGRSPANQGGWRRSHTSGIHLLLRIAQGRWPPDPVPTSPCENFHRQLCNDYAQWLADARGLASLTISSRRTSGLRFLTWLGERGSQENCQSSGWLTSTSI
jgi:hypothetical protein